jgi:molybdopterin/thiamine biosynthesis adenylyltransferase
LKDYAIARSPGRLELEQEPGVTTVLDDPDGHVAFLLSLADGTRTVPELAAKLHLRCPGLTADDVTAAMAQLDEAGLFEDATARPAALSAHQQERYAANLAFFATCATLERDRFTFQERLRAAHVVQLGAGGIGSALLPILCGLGVGRVTLVDCDSVTLDNLNRQFLYGESDIGRAKLERAALRARELNAELCLSTIQRQVRCPEDIASLLGDADLVLSAIDDPAEVAYWVNDACVAARIPFVTAATYVMRGVYYSVAPGASGCTGCWADRGDPATGQAATRRQRANRGTGAAVGLLGALVGLEAMRYLTGFAPPVAAGRQWLVDLASGATDIAWEWQRRQDCRVCGQLEATPARGDAPPAGTGDRAPELVAG